MNSGQYATWAGHNHPGQHPSGHQNRSRQTLHDRFHRFVLRCHRTHSPPLYRRARKQDQHGDRRR